MRNQKEIYDYCNENGIYRTMGKYLMSAATVRSIVRKQKMREQHLGELSALRTITANALKRAGVNDRQQLAAFYEKEGEEGLLKLRNIGWKGIKEIRALLGLEEMEDEDGQGQGQ